MPIKQQIRSIEKSFSQLAVAFRELGAGLAAMPAPTNGPRPARKAPKLTAARRATLKLQGRYMGTLRGLRPAQKRQVIKVRAEKGIAAALKVAGRMG